MNSYSYTTTYTYDKANQLVTSTVNGVTTHYKYDAAGRMIQAGDKSYIYNGQNKVAEVRQNGKTIARFEYNIDGQIAKAIYGDKVEEFMWDGLALIQRNDISYLNEPYVTGGNPILSSKDGVMFNDMLGSTLSIGGKAVNMTAFGESTDTNAMYTGKPYIGELGYAFLFRNYRSDHGKWQTTDPLGYPDGWNNLAYCNNEATIAIDGFGLSVWQWTKETLAALSYGVLYIFNGAASLTPGIAVKWYFGPGTIPTGITSLYTAAVVQNMDSVTKNIDSYYNSAITQFNNKSSIGTYNLSSRHYYVSNNKHTAWGAIVGTSSLTISGSAIVTQSSDGGRDVVINLTCRFYDDIDWKSYEELVVDHNGSFANWGVTSYIEGALDVWLDNGLKSNYEIDVSWTKSFNKHFSE